MLSDRKTKFSILDAEHLEILQRGDVRRSGGDALTERLRQIELEDRKRFWIRDDDRVEIFVVFGDHVVELEDELARLHISAHTDHLP